MGPFKMTRTVLRNLVRGPATRRYPEVPARVTPGTRGHVAIDPATCRSCGICSKRCPCVAIRLDKEAKVWEIDRMRCSLAVTALRVPFGT